MTTFTRLRKKIRLACDECVREAHAKKRADVNRALYLAEGGDAVCEDHRQERLLNDRRS